MADAAVAELEQVLEGAAAPSSKSKRTDGRRGASASMRTTCSSAPARPGGMTSKSR